MKITVKSRRQIGEKSPALAISLFEEEVSSGKLPTWWTTPLRQMVHHFLSRKEFKGKFQDSFLLYPENPELPERLLLLGLGKKNKFEWECFRKTVGRACASFSSAEIEAFDLALPGEGIWRRFDPTRACREAAEAATLASYRFDEYLTSKENGEPQKTSKSVQLLTTKKGSLDTLLKGIETGITVADCTNLARDLSNHPSSYMTPTRMAQTAQKNAGKTKLKCHILERSDMEKLGMGGLLGVAKGAKEPPKFIILEYLPRGRREKPLVFVGKGITFDSGGISIKPAEGMEKMKYDMSGGAAVIGALLAISRLKLNRNVVGLVPTTENMPDGSAYKPGDILKMMSGKTVEVVNTDAEGRLILADALHYAQRYKPAGIVDLATLTGACIVALGDAAIGLMGNNARLIRAVRDAGERVGERCWELPMWDDYKELVKGEITDLKNAGARKAGTIAGGQFLMAFVGETPWVHLDIAGTAWTEKDKPYHPKGATGVGIRLLVDLASRWGKK